MELIKKSIKTNYKLLQAVMDTYHTARQNVTIDDLFRDGKTLTTNLQLLEDAARYTKDLADETEYEIHYKAKEALLLWCRIYCEKCLAKRYNPKSEDNQESITAGTLDGVLECYERLREKLKELFDLPEEERREILKKKYSVRYYMLNFAIHKSATIYNDMQKQKYVQITEEEAKEYEKQEIPVFMKKNQYFTERPVPMTIFGDENKSVANPEVMKLIASEVETEAQKLMDDAALVHAVESTLKYLDQKNKLSPLEKEFIQDVFMDRKQKPFQKQQEWEKNKVKGCPNNIYTFRDSILKKMAEAMEHLPCCVSLADLVQRRGI